MDNQKKSLNIIPDEKPWYQDGLAFECTGCGKCCTGSPGYVWVTVEEIEKIANSLQMPLADFGLKYLREINGAYALKERLVSFDCVFLEGSVCSIYQDRPKQCRTFPWWKQNLRTKEDWEYAARRCEGINLPTAPVFEATEITKQLQNGDGIHDISGGN
jgi:Fe-S-cluster containining protein